MSMLSFSVRSVPKAQPRVKVGRKRAYNPKSADGWKALIVLGARKAMESSGFKKATGPVRLVVRFWFPRPIKPVKSACFTGKPDLDNLEKAVMDAMTFAGVWKDDALVAQKETSKEYVAPGAKPGAYICVQCI